MATCRTRGQHEGYAGKARAKRQVAVLDKKLLRNYWRPANATHLVSVAFALL